MVVRWIDLGESRIPLRGPDGRLQMRQNGGLLNWAIIGRYREMSGIGASSARSSKERHSQDKGQNGRWGHWGLAIFGSMRVKTDQVEGISPLGGTPRWSGSHSRSGGILRTSDK